MQTLDERPPEADRHHQSRRLDLDATDLAGFGDAALEWNVLGFRDDGAVQLLAVAFPGDLQLATDGGIDDVGEFVVELHRTASDADDAIARQEPGARRRARPS